MRLPGAIFTPPTPSPMHRLALAACPLALAACCLLVTACGGDDDGTQPVTADGIVGTWIVGAADADLSVTTTDDGIAATTRARNTTEASDATLTFDADGTFATFGSLTLATRVGLQPERLAVLPFGAQGGEWRLDGSTVTFSGGSPFPNLRFTGVLPTTLPALASAEAGGFRPARRLTLVARVDTSFDVASGGRPSSTFDVAGTQTLTLGQQ